MGGVVYVVLDPFAPGHYDRKLAAVAVGAQVTDLRRHLRLARDEHEAHAPGEVDRDEKPFVILLEHQLVVSGRSTQDVAPHLPRPHRFVGPDVIEALARPRPRRAVVDVLYDVRQVVAGTQVPEPQFVTF